MCQFRILIVVTVLCASPATLALAGSPAGLWERPSSGTKIRFYDCAGKLCARIESVKDPARRKTVGTVIMNGGQKVSENRWKGKILNTENGKVYSGEAILTGGGLRLQGCVLGGLICSGETWRRVQ
ncbi:MAG TPA: DUF2147 domain-containing protein [Hyphomicrobiaceae bacterium]|nr:DUF2147 domain-containing protein [Hyphomicrobiaceae bacterium]